MARLTSLASLLLLAIQAANAAPQPQPRDDSGLCGSNCLRQSLFQPELDVDDFYFHASYIFTTPAHQNSWGYVSFNLTGPASSNVTACSAQSDQLQTFFYGNEWYPCTVPAGSPNGTAATFEYFFSETNGWLSVNETWVCEEPGENPVTFEASGTIQFNLTCNTTSYTNPNWTEGQIYSDTEIQCQPVNLSIKPYVETAVWP